MDKLWARLRHGFGPHALDRVLDNVEDLPMLSIMGAIVGLLTGFVIIAFRITIDYGSRLLLDIDTDRFEELSRWLHLLLPITGAGITALLIWILKKESRFVGVVHVMERVSSSDARMPLRNTIVQFFGGSISLITGISGGREGPAIHLGAAVSSFFANRLGLPHNGVRVIVACGIASAIATSFNMPIAGVVFTMEVILMEYTIAGFLPVMLSAFTATALVREIYGPATVLHVNVTELVSYWEIPYLVVVGVIVGVVASIFNYTIELFTRISLGTFWQRMIAAGVLTGLVAFMVPEVLGMGWDTADGLISGVLEYSIPFLLVLIIAKLVVTSACVGLGMPVGIIGPTVVLGVMLGVTSGVVATSVFSTQEISDTSFYGLLGATAMLAAVLNAPLTAIMTVVELSASQNIVLPSLLIIVASTLTTYVIYGRRSVFVARLQSMGIPYPPHPSIQYLRRTNVRSALDSDFYTIESAPPHSHSVYLDHLQHIRSPEIGDANWVIIPLNADSSLVSDVEVFEQSVNNVNDVANDDNLNLNCFTNVPNLSLRSSLEEVLETMNKFDVDLLTIKSGKENRGIKIVGVVTREYVEHIQTQLPSQRSGEA